ncbi:lipopolysaccharide assembly LapA domain-containing protein [Sporosarcina sp. YIM B06819]|uniref:LapA family protein n=1 Tax=Sporosarcina sp. YIM B06819 TaxID=3081769 RepID=UPI00298CCC45|nr:lipopolysaccharide assembly protein LapA domain-containing protein [Sporosarcina sp. YIM B06819]
MKFQWNLLYGLLFSIIIALFAIFNIESVQVNYIFGKTDLPLVMVILCSALLGAMVSVFVAMFRTVQSNHRVKELQKEITLKEQTIAAQQNEIAELQKKPKPIAPKSIANVEQKDVAGSLED